VATGGRGASATWHESGDRDSALLHTGGPDGARVLAVASRTHDARAIQRAQDSQDLDREHRGRVSGAPRAARVARGAPHALCALECAGGSAEFGAYSCTGDAEERSGGEGGGEGGSRAAAGSDRMPHGQGALHPDGISLPCNERKVPFYLRDTS
jgi:hypothetical protein